MARRRYTPVHMRCTASACRKRFKAIPLDGHRCPVCGGNAKPDPWAGRKGWKDYQKLCDCGGVVYPSGFSTHRRGCAGCLHHGGDAPPIELPGTGEEFPF